MLNRSLSGLLARCLAIALVMFIWFAPAPIAQAQAEVAVLPFLKNAFAGATPTNLGLQAGHLVPCPDTPNCVGSQQTDDQHRIAPIPYQGDRQTARETLLKVLTVVPGATVVETSEDYIRAEFTSKLMGFVDDGEFYFPDHDKVIQVRSAARLGQSDLGVNRTRLTQIRLAMQDLGA
jgi:uncharacterized protein (DUF1499 family)